MAAARQNRLNTAAAHGALILYTLIAMFPVFVIVINSFKTRKAIFREPLAMPNSESFSLIGYQTVLKQGDFFLYFQNSMIVTVGSLFFILLFGAMAAFALAEYRFKGNTLMGLYMALGIMIPIRIGTVAILEMMVQTGLVNTLWALILVYTAQGLPLAVFILSEFMRQVSDDLKNAGRIDGLSEYRIFFRLVLPLVRPAMATVAVFNMIPIWNDLWFPLILAPAEEVKTLTLGSQVFIGQFVTDWNAVLSALSLGDLAGDGALRDLLTSVDPRHHIGGREMRVVVAGLGNMGRSHALAYHAHPDAEIVGLVNRSDVDLPEALQSYARFESYEEGLALEPDLVCIATYSDSHAQYAIAAMEAGADVFIEKPLATTVEDAKRVVATAQRLGRKLVVGYILRHHPSWQRLIAEARSLGGPYVFRMNLNQQSDGPTWETHKSLMQTTSPIVDCGVHYVDVMCQITDATPVRVSGMGLRLSNEIAPDMYNYGQLQVWFADGSVGWYEAGWGPMMSETAFFVKDVVSPNGSVSITDGNKAASDDVDGHTKVGGLLVHRLSSDTLIDLPDEPGHQELCDAEQAFMINAILQDSDLTRHMSNAVQSLAICLAADESIRTCRPVELGVFI